ncbi:BCSC C-terminal domain-containing protein [Cedecea davisae]|uniref:BCSC C-terminal domain-containing protein n=1 Tax=Cedecea davisae TaxID=158484 RepID=A0ABS6DLR4_9ENTR|nr:cellulose biosynthesis protein BcsC [Cedecea davisae]MBU4684107.1 BCSC C-terminal domain-containing protein [Cedecea davisae]MBU4689047.1 BCSC C-terminal domain-containing protein [Cedecea davisae]
MKNKKINKPLPAFGLSSLFLLALPFTSFSAQDVLEQLFAQAQFWHERNHPEDAQSALKKILSVEPNNPDALYLLSLYALQQGKKEEAQAWKAKLRKASPDGAKIQQLEGEVATSAIAPGRLAQARRLAKSGNPAAAVKVYEELFIKGEPASSLASEYYQTLAAIPERREQAITALTQRHQQNPRDAATALALGKMLIWQEQSRREGIALLATLSPSTPEAAKDLRQALLWLHPRVDDRPLFEAWQQKHPNDAEVEAHYSSNVAGSTVSEGYRTVEKGNLSGADKAFRQALNADPENSSALGGLGIIAMRKEQFAEAHDYLKRAASRPGADQAKWASLAEKASFYAALSAAKTQAARGNWNEALAASEPLLKSSGDENLAVNLFRADVLRRKGDLPEAEQAYRTLNAQTPSTEVQQALYYILTQQHKTDEAAKLLQTLPPAFRAKVASGQPVSVDPIRQQAAQVLDAGDTLQAERLLRGAMQKQPSNAWVRLDLARVLLKQGDEGQAARLIAPMEQSARKDELYVAALYRGENKQWSQALAVITRIPRGQWNKDISALRRRAAFNLDLANADKLIAGGDNAGAKTLLLPLSNADTVSPADAGHLAASLYKAGLSTEADALLANPVLLAKSSPGEIAKIKLGSIINEADKLRERGQYAQAYDKLIVKLHDDPHNKALMLAMARVYQSGKMFKESRSVYQYVLSQEPHNQDALTGAINLALASGDNPQAGKLLSELDDKNSPEHLFLAARVARGNGEARQALTLLRQAKQQLLGITRAGSAATVGGLNIADNPFVDDTQEPTALPWQTTAPLAGAASSGQKPQLIAQVSKLLDETREKLASWVETSLSLRERDGEDGLGGLSETKTSLAFSTVPFSESRLKFSITPVMLNAGSTSGQASNRFGSGALQQATAAWQATQASQKSATDSTAAADAARKALADKSNARIKACQDPTSSACEIAMRDETDAQDAFNLAQQQIIQPHTFGPDDYAAGYSGEQRRSGTELSLALTGDRYQADIGTTPLGQGSHNLVGGLRWSPTVAGNTQLTLNAERRAVTDSLLSYVGTKDKYSGKYWGAVVKSGGGLSVNYDNGDAGAYGGGSFYQYQGQNVPENQAVLGNAGFYYRPLHAEDREVKIGVNTDYMNFAKNLGNFSFGQGGYFSPQNYISVSMPVEYSRNAGNWNYKLSGTVGYQAYSQKQSDYFPTESEWQNNLDWLVDAGFGRESHYAAKTSTGVSYNLKLQGNYKLNPQMAVGGKLSYDTAGEYSEANALIYFKYLLDNQ